MLAGQGQPVAVRDPGRHDGAAIENRAPEQFDRLRGRRLAVDPDRYRDAVDAGGRTDIYDLCLGNAAVGDNRQIAAAGQDLRCPPVHFDDPALRSAIDIDPVAWPIRLAEAQYDAGEDGT